MPFPDDPGERLPGALNIADAKRHALVEDD
jgi:hypothetical protein